MGEPRPLPPMEDKCPETDLPPLRDTPPNPKFAWKDTLWFVGVLYFLTIAVIALGDGINGWKFFYDMGVAGYLATPFFLLAWAALWLWSIARPILFGH